VLALAVLGVTGKVARTLVHERSEPTAEVADAIVAFCLGGLAAD
jgi:hypothetical protein